MAWLEPFLLSALVLHRQCRLVELEDVDGVFQHTVFHEIITVEVNKKHMTHNLLLSQHIYLLTIEQILSSKEVVFKGLK